MSREPNPQTRKLVQVMRDIMEVRVSLKESGASEATIAQTTGAMLRDGWPDIGRVWNYHCETCGDTGWQPRTCTPQTPCGRPFRLPGAHSDDATGKGRCSPGHDYVQPCLDCARGYQRRADLSNTPKPDDHAAAGKTSKPRGFTRWNG